jgi:hypothetical protein
MFLTLTSCSTPIIHIDAPRLLKPERPLLIPIRAESLSCLDLEVYTAMAVNKTRTKHYIEQLELLIDTYNEYDNSKTQKSAGD